MNEEALKSIAKAVEGAMQVACDEKTAQMVIESLSENGWSLVRSARRHSASSTAMERNAKLADRHWKDHDEAGAFGFASKADPDDPAMQRILGACYFFGNGTDADERQGMELLSAAAEAGDVEAQELLGERYKYGGENVVQDYDMAVKWLTLAAESGNHLAEGELGDMYLEGMVTGDPDVPTAIAWLEKAVAGGDASAAGGLGDVYYYGRGGVAKDLPRALELYEKGRAAGNWNCADMVGWMCERGEGTFPDLERALDCYREGSDNGNERCMDHLRNLCERLGSWVNVIDRANAGDVEAQCELADAYDSGADGMEQNYNAAYKWYERAAGQEDIHGITCLGRMYWDGAGCTRDRAKAVALWEQAAKAGDAFALNELGIAFKGDEFKDVRRAISCFQAAADKGNFDAVMNLAYEYCSGDVIERDFEKAFVLYRRAAEEGYPDAQRSLAHMCEVGEGTKVDLAEAERWLRSLAEQGDERDVQWLSRIQRKRELAGLSERSVERPRASKDTERENARLAKEEYKANNLAQAFAYAVNASPEDPLVQRILGQCYRSGTGTSVDERKAFACFGRASALGDAQSQYEMGWMCYTGSGVIQDYVRARAAFEQSAQKGHLPAMSMLGYLFLKGIGGDRDPVRAVALFGKAADGGDVQALLHLGCAYRNGDGVRQDSRLAEDCFKRAAEKKDVQAYAHLGALYNSRDYGLYSPAEAFRCLSFAAERGHAVAQYNLALMYENGECVSKDLAKAVDWYGRSAKGGFEKGRAAAQRIAGQNAADLFGADQKSAAPYRAFISYRRVGGREYARNLYLALRCRGIKTFFDYTSLRDGAFNEEIFRAIEQAPNIVLMVSEGALDRCADKDDWVRRELEYAKKLGKKIIPVAPSGCSRDLSALPESLADLRNEQVSGLDTDELFEESVDKIIRVRFKK